MTDLHTPLKQQQEDPEKSEDKQEEPLQIIQSPSNSVISVSSIEDKYEPKVISHSIIYNIINTLPIWKELEEKMYIESLPYMKRKLYLLQKETREMFGAFGDMKKSYSKVQREQMELQKERNNNENDLNVLNKKRKNDNGHSGYTPIKKVKVNWNNNMEDFGEFMANAKKNKPVIQQEKERFLDRINKEKEKQLMKEKDLLKEQVLKFEL